MSFTQKQLEDAYDQMADERAQDNDFAKVAADLLGQKTGLAGKFNALDEAWNWSHGAVTPFTTDHVLTLHLCEYDDWQSVVNSLIAAGVKMNATVAQYNPAPEGVFDVSSEAAFAGRPKLNYKVRIVYYDSYAGGY